MDKGIYIALSGAVLKEKQMELISQNLANSSSSAYKRLKISFKDHLIHPESQAEGRIMSDVGAVRTDFSEGGTHLTGNPLDIALEGSGFITLEKNLYTRRGDLKRNSDGYLTNQSGLKVMGKGGFIRLPEGKVDIGPGGEIMVNQTPVDTIKLVDFKEKGELVRIGEDLFRAEGPGTPATTRVKQGYLEGSNVEIVKEMTNIILTLREFQAFQKLIQGFDEAAAKMNEVARL